MKIFTSRQTFTVFCSLMAGVMMLQSCGGNDNTTLTNQQVAELQSQLDSTMQLYYEVKTQNADFNNQLAKRDSAINAQAEEIQGLIDQLGGKKNIKATNSERKTDNAGKELAEKENTIKQLRKQIDQQTKELNALKSGQKKSDSGDREQIAKLKKQIAEQEKQIGELKKSAAKQPAPANCDQVKQNYESKMADLNGQIKSYKNEIADLNKQIKNLKSDVASLKNATPKSDSSAIAELNSTRAELTAMSRQLNDCRKLNTQYQNDVKAANDNLTSVKAELTKCQSDLDASLAQAKAAGSVSKTEQLLREELTSLTEKEAACRYQNEEMAKAQKSYIQKCENDKQALQSTITDLRQQVVALQARVDQLAGENDVLLKSSQKGNDDAASAKTIADLTAQVESQRQQIEQLQADIQRKNNELAAAKSNAKPSKGTVNQKLAELQALCDSYVAEIERLRAENEQLKVENAELKEQVSSSATLFAENERLQQKVKLASVLVTSDLKAIPGKSVKIGNVVKPTTKAAQTKCVRLDCRLVDNNVIDPGSITIYARISNAADRAIYNGSAEDFTFDMNGTPMQYTTKQDIEFTGAGRQLTMVWKKSDAVELAPGLYWVKLYANGYEIGKASFKLD